MKIGSFLKDLCFPPRCVFCDEVIAPKERPVCPRCIQQGLPRIIEMTCPHCGREKREFCTCKWDNFLTDGIAAPFYFDGPVETGVYRMKSVEDVDRTRYFVQEMLETAFSAFGDREINYVTAVPMRPEALSARGFNQAEWLARELSRSLHVPYAQLLQKCLDTPSQKGLTAEQRRVNLLGAFDIKTRIPLAGSRILLVDDVVTTGSTTNECAKMLKLAGADAVYVLALALTRHRESAKE